MSHIERELIVSKESLIDKREHIERGLIVNNESNLVVILLLMEREFEEFHKR